MRVFFRISIAALLLGAIAVPAAVMAQEGMETTPSDEATGSMETTPSQEATPSDEATGPSAPFTEEATPSDEATGEALPFTGGGETALVIASLAGAAGYAVRRFSIKR